MGYLRHECMVVSSWYAEDVAAAHVAASAIFNEAGYGGLVSGVQQHIANAGAAFFIAPDGSKEGWTPSDDCAAARAKFIEYLEQSAVDWALVLLGGDDGEYRVLQSPGVAHG